MDGLQIVLVVTHHIYSRFTRFTSVPRDAGNAQNGPDTFTAVN